MSKRFEPLTLAIGLVTFLLACNGDGTGPKDGAVVEFAFVPASVTLGIDATATVRLENRGTSSEGPIQLVPGQVLSAGVPVVGATLEAMPGEFSSLSPGARVAINLSLLFASGPEPGEYQVTLEARVDGDSAVSLPVSFNVEPPQGNAASVEILGNVATARQGDVIGFTAEARDSDGQLISDPALVWSVAPAGAGLILADGRFVGYSPGAARVVATAGSVADTVDLTIEARGLNGSFQLIGRGEVTDRFTSDLWVHGSYAYTGTWSCRSGSCGDRMHVWSVSDPASPSHSDELIVDARTVNDVKIRADGTLGVLTHEGSGDGLNGITLFDLTDPAHPTVITRVTNSMTNGVHNVWVEGDYVYVAVDHSPGGGLRVVDISDPSNPAVVASFYAGSSILHDVYVRDGLAFLSHWNAGLIILDVGNGIAGGTPGAPVEVSRIQTAGGQVHNAWYWPSGGYVFVGEEDHGTPGVVHVVDVGDLSQPEEVATFRVPGVTPHNFWLDEDRAILYVGWYEAGLRAVDVSGVLLGQLDRQGREIAGLEYGSGTGCQTTGGTCAWAPQLHDGLVYVSDMNTGLWIFEPQF